MEIFKNELDRDRFSSTNHLWNKLGLNKAWSVGYTTTLIKQKRFKNKEEWYSYYFESGEKRLEQIKKLESNEVALINGNVPTDNKFLNKINYNYGRTKLEIALKGIRLYEEIVKEGNPHNLTEDECKYIAFYRVVCETWNGVIGREYSTKETIIEYLANAGYEASIIDTAGAFDYEYGVDFELYYHGHIVCGIQIKPDSYKSNKDYLVKAKEINENKNNKYKNKYGRNVHYVYSNEKGFISNYDILKLMLNEVKCMDKITA